MENVEKLSTLSVDNSQLLRCPGHNTSGAEESGRRIRVIMLSWAFATITRGIYATGTRKSEDSFRSITTNDNRELSTKFVDNSLEKCAEVNLSSQNCY